MTERISGWFMSFTEKEEAELAAALSSMEYEAGPKGLKEFVFDCLDEEAESRKRENQDKTIAGQVIEFLRKNPDTFTIYAALGKSAVDTIMAKIKKARERGPESRAG